jgi:hypothetical protein
MLPMERETPRVDEARPVTSVDGLDKVYAEAGQWVRLCNTIVWQMAAVFIPHFTFCWRRIRLYEVQATFRSDLLRVFRGLGGDFGTLSEERD